MKNFIILFSCFGHEIMAVAIAKALGMAVKVASKKETKEEYEKDVNNIYDKLSPFYSNIEIVSFEEKERFVEAGWDVIQELKEGRFDASLWGKMAASKLTPSFEGLRRYQQLEGKMNVLFVPQKLQSDGECGVTAAQQSLNPQVLSFMKGTANLVLGQHFHKVNDLATVEALAKEFDLYVPGMNDENPRRGSCRVFQHVPQSCRFGRYCGNSYMDSFGALSGDSADHSV